MSGRRSWPRVALLTVVAISVAIGTFGETIDEKRARLQQEHEERLAALEREAGEKAHRNKPAIR